MRPSRRKALVCLAGGKKSQKESRTTVLLKHPFYQQEQLEKDQVCGMNTTRNLWG